MTLTGPGGTGKTRLAIAGGGEVAESYPRRRLLGTARNAGDPALVLATIAAGARSEGRRWRNTSATGDPLLLLDNLEHVIDAAPSSRAARRPARTFDLLVTSRERLQRRRRTGVRGAAAHSTGRRRLLRRARARSGYRVLQDEPVVGALRRLDNLPLALELAAARAKASSPGQLLERLATAARPPSTGGRATPSRGSGRSCDDRLVATTCSTPDEQQLFARLAVFAGGCTLDAAEEVCGADLDTLQSLVDKSLLASRRASRFWMLETIRDFAAERLLDDGAEHEALARRHADCTPELAERRGSRLRDPDSQRRRLDSGSRGRQRARRSPVARQPRGSWPGSEIVWGLGYFWVTPRAGGRGAALGQLGTCRSAQGTAEGARVRPAPLRGSASNVR